MSGGVSVGAGGSSGVWSPLQAGAGLDPAHGPASPGYVERGSSGSGAWFAGLLVLVAVPGVNLALGPVVFGPGERVPLFPWGLPAVFALILMVSHFVVCIVQGVRAHRGGVTRFGGIPFFS